MSAFFRSMITFWIFLASTICYSQNFPAYQVDLPAAIPANTSFPIVVTAIGICRYPYLETEQPPDFQLIGNQLEMTVYLRAFGQNTVPIPPCINRTQIYRSPVLPPGVYEMRLFSRFYSDVFSTFGARLAQGSLAFVVGEVVPVTQIPATSGWSIALLLFGIMGLARWVSGQSGGVDAFRADRNITDGFKAL
jgi:hypothetical protein